MPSYISPSSSSCTLTSAALRRAETLNPTNFKRACSGGALSSVRCCAATRTCRGSSCTPSSAARAETTSTAITLGLRSGPPRTWTRRIAPASSVSTRTAFTPRNLRSTASAASVGDPPCSGTSGTTSPQTTGIRDRGNQGTNAASFPRSLVPSFPRSRFSWFRLDHPVPPVVPPVHDVDLHRAGIAEDEEGMAQQFHLQHGILLRHRLHRKALGPHDPPSRRTRAQRGLGGAVESGLAAGLLDASLENHLAAVLLDLLLQFRHHQVDGGVHVGRRVLSTQHDAVPPHRDLNHLRLAQPAAALHAH